MVQRHDPQSGLLRPASAGAGDALSDVLASVRLTGALFFLWDVSWPFETPVPAGRSFAHTLLPGAQEIISYHIVAEGTCWGAVPGDRPTRLETGDVLLIPRGDPYVIASTERACARPTVPASASLEFFRQMAAGELPFVVAQDGGGTTSSRLVCGFLGCDLRPFNPVLGVLPRLVHVRRRPRQSADRIDALLEHALTEAREPGPGSRSVLVRLSELLFVEVVRRRLLEDAQAGTGWLAAFRDPVAGRALLALHGAPSDPWTLDRLAAAVGASRSVLAERFARTVGLPPIQYLARWRVQLAAGMLASGSTKIAAVAHEVGYDSESAFSRAFKRLVGVGPSAWRRQASSREPPRHP